MTTRTDSHLRIARDAGYAGVEVRAERLVASNARDETFHPAYWSEDPSEVARRGRALTEQVLTAAGAG